MTRCFGVVVLIIIGVLLLAPRVTSAQAISGTVTDTTGSVLPGVTVEARSPALIEQVRTASTNGAGQYQIVELRPGTYSITFTLPGFGTLVREGIELTSGFTATVDIQLRVGAIAETVTVTGASPLVDVQNVTTHRVATREVIETIPAARSFQGLGVLIPGIVTGGQTNNIIQDVGGQSGQSHMTMAIHGGRTRDQVVHIDSLSTDAPLREDSSTPYIPDSAVQEYVFDYSANGAQTETGGVQVNHIPAEGGGTLHGGAFFNVSPPALQTTNFDDRLRALGVNATNRVKENWNGEVKLGGPIVRNRLWFFATHGRFRADEYVLGVFYSQDPRAIRQVPDLSRQAVSEQNGYTSVGRLTWQATPRNKFTGFVANGLQHYPTWLPGLIGPLTVTPEASVNLNFDTKVYQATWTSTVTSRLLLDAGVSLAPLHLDWPGQSYAANDVPGILDAATLTVERNGGAYPTRQLTKRDNRSRTDSYRGSVSYVTGSHAFKTGFLYTTGWLNEFRDFHRELGALPMSYLTFSGTPLQVTYYDAPHFKQYGHHNLGLYGQDQWRRDRLTVNAGVRFDYLQNYNPAQAGPPTIFVPVAKSYPAQVATSWKDLSPRFGVAYDLFGDGKTALKASASRYVLRAGNGYALAINPLETNRVNARAWTDRNDNFFPDGDPLNPLANGELGPSTNRDFANPHVNTFYDRDWAFGFHRRPADWEFSTSVQRELLQGLSLNVGYFRRVYTNLELLYNRAVGANDVDFFCVTAPAHPALPNGGGQQVCGIPDLKPSTVGYQSKIGLQDNITTGADNLGTRRQHWNGVDVTADARLRGILLQGGLSVGKTSVNECDLLSHAPNVSFRGTGTERVPRDHCDNITVSSVATGSVLGGSTTPYQAQVKLLGSYLLPYQVQVSAAYQTFPGRERLANVTFRNAAVGPSLGRPLSQTNSVLVNVIEPGTTFGDRIQQLDLRASKTFNFGRNKLRANLDVFNAINDNSGLNYPTAFNPANPRAWEAPGVIMPARSAKVSVQYDF
jgi:carboxypeptidase family protein